MIFWRHFLAAKESEDTLSRSFLTSALWIIKRLGTHINVPVRTNYNHHFGGTPTWPGYLIHNQRHLFSAKRNVAKQYQCRDDSSDVNSCISHFNKKFITWGLNVMRRGATVGRDGTNASTSETYWKLFDGGVVLFLFVCFLYMSSFIKKMNQTKPNSV